jgi:uncharacterized membrane protein YraQ (UPF0718 family)
MKNNFKNSVKKAGKSLWRMFPIILGTILLVSLANTLIPKSFYTSIFGGNIIDPIIGSAVGSILAGNPVVSYILGGELLKHGISLIAVTAFILSWVTVGLVQLPAEASILGKKFALTRNITAFILSIFGAVITVIIFNSI